MQNHPIRKCQMILFVSHMMKNLMMKFTTLVLILIPKRDPKLTLRKTTKCLMMKVMTVATNKDLLKLTRKMVTMKTYKKERQFNLHPPFHQRKMIWIKLMKILEAEVNLIEYGCPARKRFRLYVDRDCLTSFNTISIRIPLPLNN